MGTEQQIRIQASGGLSDSDIESMVKEAEENAENDKMRRESVEAKNQAESLIHQTEASLKELGDDVPAQEKEAVDSALSSLKEVLEGDDAEQIKEKTDELMQASMKIGELLYRKSQEENAGEPDNASDVSDDNSSDSSVDAEVVDAEEHELQQVLQDRFPFCRKDPDRSEDKAQQEGQDPQAHEGQLQPIPRCPRAPCLFPTGRHAASFSKK